MIFRLRGPWGMEEQVSFLQTVPDLAADLKGGDFLRTSNAGH